MSLLEPFASQVQAAARDFGLLCLDDHPLISTGEYVQTTTGDPTRHGTLEHVVFRSTEDPSIYFRVTQIVGHGDEPSHEIAEIAQVAPVEVVEEVVYSVGENGEQTETRRSISHVNFEKVEPGRC